MTGPKLNEGALLLPEDQRSTKATARYVRGSASKVREVLDLVRGLDVRRADEVLQFSTRGAAVDVRKVLASAVANAVHNDEQDADELFVLAAFADEGPTLRRFRPRARGRATRIRKRTCHITIVVARMSDERLEVVQNRQQAQSAAGRRRAGTTAQSRRDRVARSRARAQGLKDGATADQSTATDGGPAADDEMPETADDTTADDTADDTRAETAPVEDAAGLPAGAVAPPEDGSVPEGHEIKGNAGSMLYHVPGSRYYDVTIAEVYFDTVESAEAAGYSAPATESGTESSTESSSTESNED